MLACMLDQIKDLHAMAAPSRHSPYEKNRPKTRSYTRVLC